MEFKHLKGKTFKEVIVVKNDPKENDHILFIDTDDVKYKLKHDQDCCESVTIEDINGDIDCLVGNPILLAEEAMSSNLFVKTTRYDDSVTWTFYKLATVKGFVDIRFFGTSNGYYSEGVSLFTEDNWGFNR